MSPNTAGSVKNTEIPAKEENLNCFDGNDWSDNAADAIGHAFNNMDLFLARYNESAQGN